MNSPERVLTALRHRGCRTPGRASPVFEALQQRQPLIASRSQPPVLSSWFACAALLISSSAMAVLPQYSRHSPLQLTTSRVLKNPFDHPPDPLFPQPARHARHHCCRHRRYAHDTLLSISLSKPRISPFGRVRMASGPSRDRRSSDQITTASDFDFLASSSSRASSFW